MSKQEQFNPDDEIPIPFSELSALPFSERRRISDAIKREQGTDLSKMSPDQQKLVITVELEEYREDHLKADRNAAWVFARNMAIMDAEERGEEWEESENEPN